MAASWGNKGSQLTSRAKLNSALLDYALSVTRSFHSACTPLYSAWFKEAHAQMGAPHNTYSKACTYSMHAQIRTHMYACTHSKHSCMHTWTNACASARAHGRTRMHIHTYTRTRARTHARTLHACMHAWTLQGLLHVRLQVDEATSTVVLDTNAGQWVQSTPNTGGSSEDFTRRCRHAVASVGPFVFVYGGLKGSQLLDDLLVGVGHGVAGRGGASGSAQGGVYSGAGQPRAVRRQTALRSAAPGGVCARGPCQRQQARAVHADFGRSTCMSGVAGNCACVQYVCRCVC